MSLPKLSLITQASTRQPSLETPATISRVPRVTLTSDELVINLGPFTIILRCHNFLERYRELTTSAILLPIAIVLEQEDKNSHQPKAETAKFGRALDGKHALFVPVYNKYLKSIASQRDSVELYVHPFY